MSLRKLKDNNRLPRQFLENCRKQCDGLAHKCNSLWTPTFMVGAAICVTDHFVNHQEKDLMMALFLCSSALITSYIGGDTKKAVHAIDEHLKKDADKPKIS